MQTRVGVLLVAIGLLAGRPARADNTIVEAQGIEVALPDGWGTATKNGATVLAPLKFKGRAIEIVTAKAMPPSTVEGMQKVVGPKIKVTLAKEVDRNGMKVVVAEGVSGEGKDAINLDLLALPAAKGAVIMMSFTRGDQDPILRKASTEVLLSARTAGPKMTVTFADPDDKKEVGIPKTYAVAMNKVVVVLDKLIVFPRLLPVEFKSCHQVNAFYSPVDHSISVCHELWDYYVDLFTKKGMKGKELDETVRGAVLFAFFHELGHALAGELTLPITGKGEDAADELATIMLGAMGESGQKAAKAAALWFLYLSADPPGKMQFLDEHSVDGQRMSSIVCLLYGANKTKYQGMMKGLGFTDTRLGKCVRDYQARNKAWGQLLASHMRKLPKK